MSMTKIVGAAEEAPPPQAGAAPERSAPTPRPRRCDRDATGRSRLRHRGPSGARGEVKERIRIAARAEFIEHGYDGATVRAIARRAECDSGLVSYYFGSKQKLFRACMDLPLDPAAEAIRLLSGGPEGAARRILDYAVRLYEETLTAETFFALMRALMTDAATTRRFQTYIRTEIIDAVGAYLGADEEFGAQLALALGSMYGIASMRYIVKLEPLASMPAERFIDLLEPILQERIDAFVGAGKVMTSAQGR